MRRDTQIGIILGVAILIVIGIFLSTRSSVKEPTISDSITSEEDTTEIEEIDISELINEQKYEIKKKAVPEEDFKEDVLVESPKKDEAMIEGEWKGVKKKVVETEKEIKDLPSDKQDLSGEEEVIISKEDNKIPPADIQGEIIHKVQSSDNLFKLAKKYYGDESKWINIYEANEDKIPSPNILHVGLKLLIPDITAASEKRVEDLPSDKRGPSAVEEATLLKEDHKISSIDAQGETVHKVLPNDNLYKIAKKYYGDESKWIIIYEANKDKIPSSNILLVGQKLLIPDITTVSEKTDDITFASEPDDEIFATVRTHTVRAGDTLYNIAKSYYDDPNMWEIISDANEDKLEDKGLLEIGQTLVIPNKQ